MTDQTEPATDAAERLPGPLAAVLFDMDGVVTDTAKRIGNLAALILTRKRGRPGPERQEAP